MTKKVSYDPVDASPVKSFFVSMLTRDIRLEEAILDLVDNCVDGVLRQAPTGKKRPFKGYRAEIEFSKDSFAITDNCGGIPWSLHDYAFRMGRAPERPPDAKGTVGIYGIGMKRAIFKMGRHCLISTQNKQDQYEVEIKPEWILDEKKWVIPVRRSAKAMSSDGTVIVIGDLYPAITARFTDDAEAFGAELERMVSTHYAFIIDKGFEVKINSQTVAPRPTKLIFSKEAKGVPKVEPFIFQTSADGVEVFVAVGFTRPIPTEDELGIAPDEAKYSAPDAGWTVLCNDRAVLYCDRTELTGWGEAGIPRYHNQFIAISGIVEFRSDDASKLPTTTTKRSIDASSSLYLQIKNKMRDGMRLFIDYTYKWKGRAAESKKQFEGQRALDLEDIREAAKALKFKATQKTVPKGVQYRPALPMPKQLEPSRRRISYVKPMAEIKVVAEYLFDNEDHDASAVGERSFDLMLKEARKQ